MEITSDIDYSPPCPSTDPAQRSSVAKYDVSIAKTSISKEKKAYCES
jgi:hypothetical protein